MVRRALDAVVGGVDDFGIEVDPAQPYDGGVFRGKVVEERALRHHGSLADHGHGHVVVAQLVYQRDSRTLDSRARLAALALTQALGTRLLHVRSSLPFCPLDSSHYTEVLRGLSLFTTIL